MKIAKLKLRLFLKGDDGHVRKAVDEVSADIDDVVRFRDLIVKSRYRYSSDTAQEIFRLIKKLYPDQYYSDTHSNDHQRILATKNVMRECEEETK